MKNDEKFLDAKTKRTTKNQVLDVKLLSSFDICNILKLNDNSRDYIIFNYEKKLLTLNNWKNLFKKEGLSF